MLILFLWSTISSKPQYFYQIKNNAEQKYTCNWLWYTHYKQFATNCEFLPIETEADYRNVFGCAVEI